MRCVARRSAGGWSQIGVGAVVLMAVTCSTTEGAGPRPRKGPTLSREFVEGRDLFHMSWEPGHPAEAGGDGLGPLYNEASCVACHNQGGTGGGGSIDKNVVLLVAEGPAGQERGASVFRGESEDLHPGFRAGPSVVLHRYATAPADKKRLEKIGDYTAIQTRFDLIGLRKTERSTPPLFGSGALDAIADKSLLDAAARKFEEFPEIKGRVARVKDGRIGRFGWKAQVATLRDFVLSACANELGLESPGRHQASLATAKEFDPSKIGLDLDARQADLMVAFVRELPRPVFRTPENVLSYGPMGITPERGRSVFDRTGCAACHAPRLGGVDGLYSDLLLHDLGPGLAGSGAYYGDSSPGRSVELAARPASGPAGSTEWRTPPLWGVASSGPYLHDGRASTLDEAIRAHGGEAGTTVERYGKLVRADQQSLLAFLRSLSAPAPDSAARR